jgi:hypothetical protein
MVTTAIEEIRIGPVYCGAVMATKGGQLVSIGSRIFRRLRTVYRDRIFYDER